MVHLFYKLDMVLVSCCGLLVFVEFFFIPLYSHALYYFSLVFSKVSLLFLILVLSSHLRPIC